MDCLKRRYTEEYGSAKGYLFLQMQLAVIAALLISVASMMLKQPETMIFSIIPLSWLAKSLKKYGREFKQDFKQYVAVFAALFAASALAPLYLQHFAAQSMAAAVKQMLYAVIGVLIIFILFKMLSSKKQLKAKVVMCDKKEALVQVDFDLLAGVKPGKYAVKNRGAKKGSVVLVNLKRKFLQPPKPYEIIKVIK